MFYIFKPILINMTNKYKNLMISTVIACTSATAVSANSTLTTGNGAYINDNQNSKSIGEYGNSGTMLDDIQLIEKLANFDRERIPERVVHARGTGAYGVFKSTSDFSKFTKAAPFAKKNKETKVFVRFSTVIHSMGSPESLRDPRGFAIKFYTSEGNWDLVGNNLPVFFIRDAMQFPDMVHSLKPDPKTNIQDPNRFFDFFSFHPESTNMITRLYSTLGIPASYRKMEGSSVHAYKFVNNKNEVFYVKFNWKPRLGVKGLTVEEASVIQANNFNHLTEDLYENIEKGNSPIWDLYAQIIKEEDKDRFEFNIVDPTKIWPEEEVKPVKIGELILNKVPENYFQTSEQSAFAPSNLIPGIEPSEDKLLQGRLFSYADTQRYRLGANHRYIPVNASIAKENNNYIDGAGYSTPKTSTVNYHPSNDKNAPKEAKKKEVSYNVSGMVGRKPLEEKALNFKQAGDFYRSLSEAEKESLIHALSLDLGKVKDVKIRSKIVNFMYEADKDYGKRLAEKVNVDIKTLKN